MIYCCGLICSSCPIHLASLEKDKDKQLKMRVSIAEDLSKIYGIKSPLIETPGYDCC